MSVTETIALAELAPCPAESAAAESLAPQPAPFPERKDHFVRRDGREFAGTHLIVDFWQADGLDDLDRVDRALRDAAAAGGATLLHIHLHHFNENGGISGVAVLAESHISVHTWPERRFAAFDVFMCGDAEPERSIAALERAFAPARRQTRTCLRGAADDHD